MLTGKLKSGTIVVAIEEKQTTCGIRYIREGSILEVASEHEEWEEVIEIYRNAREKKYDNTHRIDRAKLRLATAEESESFTCGNYYIKESA